MPYKIARFYDFNHRYGTTESLGDVDIRPKLYDSITEKVAAEESLLSFGISETPTMLRLITVTDASSLGEAINQSNIIFEETVDLLLRYPMAKISNCSDAGYFIDLETLQIQPFTRPDKVNDSFGNMFHVNNGIYFQVNSQQFIASGRNDELVQSYLRSLNWYNKGKKQNRLYLRFLFSWISLETICKVSDIETIVSRLCLTMGFPLKQDCKKIDIDFINYLMNSVNDYRQWRTYIFDHFEECRILRNNIVHSGFKETDIDINDMRIKMYLIDYASSTILSLIEQAITSAKTTLIEAWDSIPVLLAKNQHLAESINGNLIYTLKNKDTMPYIFRD
jgi:hypothetical protein